MKLLLCLVTTPQTDSQPLEDVYVLPGEVLTFEQEEDGAVIEACLNSGILSPMENMLAPDGGVHTLTLVSRDQAGNVSAPKLYRLRVDGEPPELVLTWDPEPFVDEQGQAWLPGSAQLLVRSRDSGSGLEHIDCQVNDMHYQADEGELVVTLPRSGPVRVMVTAVDKLGNRSSVVERSMIADALPPRGEIRFTGVQAEHKGQLITAAEVGLQTVKEDLESGLANWEYTLDDHLVEGQKWPESLAEGTYSAASRITDRVGNSTTLPARSFQVDRSPPRIEWEIQGDYVENDNQERFYRPPVSLRASGMDAVFGACDLTYSWNGNDWRPLTETLVFQQQSVLLRARDGVGNEQTVTARWQRDQQSPVITLQDQGRQVLPPGERVTIYQGDPLFPSATDEGCGVEKMEYRIYDLYYHRLPQEFRFDVTGRFRLIIRAEDRLGNQTKYHWPLRVLRKPSEVAP